MSTKFINKQTKHNKPWVEARGARHISVSSVSVVSAAQMPVYAVLRGRQTGVFMTWAECKAQIHHFSNAVYKKFDSLDEAHTYLATQGAVPTTLAGATSPPTTDIRSFFHRTTINNPNTSKAEATAGGNATVTAGGNAACEHEHERGAVHYVYTDGACVNNGKKDAVAGAGVYFGHHDARNVSVCVKGKQSNNTAEVTAILEAFDILGEHLHLHPDDRWVIVTDSQYALRYAYTLGEKHARECWCQDIPNKALVRRLYETVSGEPRVTMMKIAAHTNKTDRHSLGNEEADRLANQAIGNTSGPSARTYLRVPYARKEDAKKRGAKWDSRRKLWYTLETNPNKTALVQMFAMVSREQ